MSGVGLGCTPVNSVDDCDALDQEWREEECSALEECELGCCCPPYQGMTNYSCEAPRTFLRDPNVIPGMSCSCGGSFYRISGTVNDGTNPLEGARVSARGISNYSLSNGMYYLNMVPNGTQVVVGASVTGCLAGSTTIADFNSNADPVNIRLNCVCNEGDCNTTMKAYCESDNNWVTYNWPVDQSAYCSRCRSQDSQCAQLDICTSGDGSCPLSCITYPDTDSDYDSDCFCSMTPNGACPDEDIFGCNEYNDADCISLISECNNGIIEYPDETCEVLPYRQENQVSSCTDDQCSNCNCISTSRCGNLILEPGENCEIGMMCANGAETCENCLCGASICTGINLNPRIQANYDYSTQRMYLNWSVFGACNSSVMNYVLFKYEDCPPSYSLNAFSPIPYSENPYSIIIPSSRRNWTDVVEGRTDYCYYVRVYYYDKPEGISNIVRLGTGDAICINPHTREFCMNNNRYQCDVQNRLVMIQPPCTPNGYCTPPDYSGRTTCTSQGVCDYCNGLYGMFANLPDLKVRVEGVSDFAPRWCKPSLDPDIDRPVTDYCFYDKTRSLFSAFKYCSDISSCYHFKSEEACENSLDVCAGKTGPCIWNWTQASKPELGGICRPFQEQLQNCSACDSKDFNWISPGCNPEICKLFGDCYFIGRGSWRGINSTCSSENLMTCGDYNDSSKCMGGQPVQVDATYDTNMNRVGGTHQFTPSNDDLELGKCYWRDFGNGYGMCLRDADGFGVVSLNDPPGWDCASNDTVCNSDFLNPETIILPRSECYTGGFYGENAAIKYVASDDRYFANDLKTYFCTAPQGSTCYPSNLGNNGTYAQTMPYSGTYDLFYYSQDAAKNLEPVKNITISVDAVAPFFSITNPETVCEPRTTQSNLTLRGSVSEDAMYICANNTALRRSVCTNNCALNNTPGCITSAGDFTLVIPVTSTSTLNNIVVYTEDHACNYFENTIQAACRNTTIPRLRINVTHYYV